jgi:hypothetical protein
MAPSFAMHYLTVVIAVAIAKLLRKAMGFRSRRGGTTGGWGLIQPPPTSE